MFPWTAEMQRQHDEWVKANPELAKEVEDEANRVMKRVREESEKKYGKSEREGVCRIDPSMMTRIIRSESKRTMKKRAKKA